MKRRVLVAGGTGALGRRLVKGLIATTDHEVVIAGRDLSRAQALADEMNAGRLLARATAMTRESPAWMSSSQAARFLVVDAAGPFQNNDYHLAKAAIAAGMHYIDLADARDFVAGFTQLDNDAKAAGIGTRPSRAIMNTSAMAQSACWPGLIC
jgi:saccharopine dehydrogenase-like NADP-dependent oxidoreductase